MPKRLLDVGNCAFDHGSISSLVEHNFPVEIDRAHGLDDALTALRQQAYDLVLVNRKMDQDGSDGLEIIRQIKQDPQLTTVPVMLLSNFAEYQQEAIAAGAESGFGKRDLASNETLEKLKKFLGGA